MPSLYDELAARALREVTALPFDFERRVEAVCDELGGMSDGAQLQFFLTPKPSLSGDTPLQALLRGPIARVVVVAEAFARA